LDLRHTPRGTTGILDVGVPPADRNPNPIPLRWHIPTLPWGHSWNFGCKCAAGPQNHKVKPSRDGTNLCGLYDGLPLAAHSYEGTPEILEAGLAPSLKTLSYQAIFRKELEAR